MAVLVGWKRWEEGYAVKGIFTFGQPRVVTSTTVKNLMNKRRSDGARFPSQVVYQRSFNSDDRVPNMPPKRLGFKEFGVPNNVGLFESKTVLAKAVLKGPIVGAASITLQGHSMDRYAAQVRTMAVKEQPQWFKIPLFKDCQ